MPQAEFIKTPTCYERRHCHLCRDPLDGWFKQAMGNNYLMPPGWPECPFGVPWSTPELPAAVPSTSLNIIVEHPDSEDAKTIQRRLYERADLYRDICINCPTQDFVAITEDGLQVECKSGFECCNGKLKHGFVHLGVNTCHKGHWKDAVKTKAALTAPKYQHASRIRPNLYVGNSRSVYDVDFIRDAKIGFILNVAVDCDDPEVQGTKQWKSGIIDGEGNTNAEVGKAVADACSMFALALENRVSFLIHCHEGFSRAPYILARALSEWESRTFDECWNEIEKARPGVDQTGRLARLYGKGGL